MGIKDEKLYGTWSLGEYETHKEIGIIGPLEFELKKVTKNMIKSMSIKTNETVIDVGCGSGDLLQKGWIGLDVDKKPLKYAQKQNSCILGNLCHLPLPNSIFDKIIASYCIEHIKDDKTAIREIYRIMKEDGVGLIEVPYNSELWSIKDEIGGHFRRYDEEFVGMLEDLGFKILKRKLHGGGLLFYYWTMRNKLSSTEEGMYTPNKTYLRIYIYICPIINWLIYLGSYLPFGKSLFLSLIVQKNKSNQQIIKLRLAL